MIKNVALYLRISREKGEQIDTLENHRNRLLRLCAERGYEYTLFEEVVSGVASIDDRIKLNEVLQRLNEFDALVCVSIDRLSRDMEYSARVFKAIELAGIPIITPERTYTEQDMMIFYMESLMANQEYKQIAKRMRSGKVDYARQGKFSAGSTPIGYVNDRELKQLQIVPEEAETVKLIYSLALSGCGATNIVKELNIRGIKTKRDKEFSNRAVLLILHNECYTGTLELNIKDKQGNITETIRHENCHEAIISKEDWLKVQELLKSRMSGDNETKLRNRGRVLSILKDLVFCYNCGWKHGFGLIENKTKTHVIMRNCKKCGASGLTEHKLLDLFYSEFNFVEVLFQDLFQKALDTPLEDNKASLIVSIKEANKKQEKLNKRLKNIKLMRADGELTKSEFEEMSAETTKALSDISQSITDLQNKINLMDNKTVAKGYEDKLNLIRAVKESQDLVEINRMLKLIVEKIYFRRWYEDGYDNLNLVIKPKGINLKS